MEVTEAGVSKCGISVFECDAFECDIYFSSNKQKNTIRGIVRKQAVPTNDIDIW